MTLQPLVGVELPIIQAPMAGAQGSALAVAVSNAGGLGSLACALLSPDALRQELAAIRGQTVKPFNVNFFCHAPSRPSAEREAAWRATLAAYYEEFGVDVSATAGGGGPAPFNGEPNIGRLFKQPKCHQQQNRHSIGVGNIVSYRTVFLTGQITKHGNVRSQKEQCEAKPTAMQMPVKNAGGQQSGTAFDMK
jgi:NAD(P)H-dependent flavin oxidoreductase YrpB (nitropropane dioxygenase family)